MVGRIKREDLDHLLRLVEAGLPKHAASHDAAHAGAGPDVPGAENLFSLPHGLWDANHSFWADKLKGETGGAWTDAQYAAAATIINSAEYQHVVFSGFADALTRGLGMTDGWYDRAAVGFGSGHDHFNPFAEHIDLVDGSTGHLRHVNIGAVLEDTRAADRAEERKSGGGGDARARASFDTPRAAVPDILLAPRPINLGEITGTRARDNGHVSLNETRAELFAQCGLTTLLPYAGWEDFKDRNHLSDGLIADLKAAYPDGFSHVDMWVGALAEKPVVGNLGPTLTAAVGAELAVEQQRSPHTSMDLLAGTHLANEITSMSWADIVSRNTGAPHMIDGFLGFSEHAVKHSSPSPIYGTEISDHIIGTDGHDILIGTAGNDTLDGGHGADVMIGGAGNDTYVVDNVHDRVVEKADGGVDTVLTTLNAFVLTDSKAAACAPAPAADTTSTAAATAAPAEPCTSHSEAATPAESAAAAAAAAVTAALWQHSGDFSDYGRAANVENLFYIGDGNFTGKGNSADNVIRGGAGDDHLFGSGGDDVLYGNAGNDHLFGGRGDDVLVGGYGDDRFDGGRGNDVLYLSSHAGNSDKGGDDDQSTDYGHDTVVLKPGFGNDVVIGFNPSDSPGHVTQDRIDVSAYTSLTDASIGSDIQIVASGPHTIITINGDSVTLLDVSASTIGKESFIFS